MFILFFSLEKGVELDCQWVEFDDVRYHIQVMDILLDVYLKSLSSFYGQKSASITILIFSDCWKWYFLFRWLYFISHDYVATEHHM